ncbi:hypothetical protein G5B46_12835 [Caulobacter sp. 602-2]|uniref:Uncharacterized protein n=1 Tax=Caulobacter sp. 602-2 TaxID=2710887 RepID=A0A6G4QXW9_9CAUL|nr:hypothetical protein [Caulobacter sp. 602-2]NGM50496.1 hypothetical protein [Caulobacter sp. 602-2]
MDWANWFPIVFFPLKILVLGIGMFFSIKWHHDQDKKKKALERERAANAAMAANGARPAGVEATAAGGQ